MNKQTELLRTTLGDCDQEEKPSRGAVGHGKISGVRLRWKRAELGEGAGPFENARFHLNHKI